MLRSGDDLGVGRVKAGTVSEEHGELGRGCSDHQHDAGLMGHPLALSPLEFTTWPADAAYLLQPVVRLMQLV